MDRRKRQKPRFVTESMSDYINRAHAIVDDETFTVMQKMQGLNLLERGAQHQFGFYSKNFADLKVVLNHCRTGLQTEPQSRREVLYERDSGRDCYEDPCKQ